MLELSPKGLDTLRLTCEEYREWQQEWERDCAATTWPLNVHAHQRDFKSQILKRRTELDAKLVAREQKPLRERVKLMIDDHGTQTLFYPYRLPTERLIHGIASTPAINSNRVSRASRGCRVRFPLPLFCTHAEVGEPIGDVVSVRLSEREIYARAEIFSNRAGDYAWKLIEDGELRCFSAGSADNKVQGVVDGIKFISSWRMRELSICRQGANSDARFEIMR
jgi:hypothetical protein